LLDRAIQSGPGLGLMFRSQANPVLRFTQRQDYVENKAVLRELT